MMGKTSTAIITFKGSHVPRQVIFGGGVYRCIPHRPKAQFFSTCFAIGHRSDVCRDSGKPRCRTCGKTVGDPVGDHDCKPGCRNCGKDHKADDPTCEMRQAADKAVREAAYLKRLQQREHDKQTNTVTIASRSPSPKRNSDTISTDRSHEQSRGELSIQGPQPIQGLRPVRGPQPVWELQPVREPRPAQITLLNETDSPTRHGNSVERDTMPVLAFIKGRLSAQWVNTLDTLTSDHTPIKIFLQVEGFPKRQRKHRLTDWDEFRKEHGDFQDMNLKDWSGNESRLRRRRS
ncbi:hypothetical protein HPB49_011295 [Dermacentor silvarum]|uniref:Uncharacterized protein n=1 Tax=Dermacentor silvarum TaxID=543639 RepID=A0ACB8DCS9_DERSI|nr:hypothetical protein HPB49_011295 [Dermacentor silvarum]